MEPEGAKAADSAMTAFEELVKQQKITGASIQTIIRNYKKDSASRKQTVEYYQERLRRLDEEWCKFETTDNQIRLLEKPPLDHDYFAKDYYTSIMEVVNQSKEAFEASILELIQTPKRTQLIPMSNTNDDQQKNAATSNRDDYQLKKPAEDDQQVDATNFTKLIRRQGAMIASLQRSIGDNFATHCLPVIQKLWENIENIHFQIYELYDNPTEKGYNAEQFILLEDVMRNIVQESNIESSSSHIPNQRAIHSESIPLPKITIPKFNGNHLKWQEFHDLFYSLVISQPMTNVHKIWYLKTHLLGEAANLIKHFSATGNNFDAAWAIVIDRYNNKRLLIGKLVQELVDTPNDTLKALHDRTQECLLALQNLQINTSTWDPLLLHILLKKLDQATRLRFEQSLLQPREIPTIKDFLVFLERHFQSMEAVGMKEKSSNSKPKVCSAVTSENQNDASCVMCKNGKHPLFACKKFLQATPSARLQFVQKQKFCFNCLKPGHGSNKCISRSCTKCNKKHNTLLHLENLASSTSASITTKTGKNSTENTSSAITETAQVDQEAASLTTAKQSKSNNYVILGTAMINIRANGAEVQCRAILDSGSQLNFITERLVKRLGLSTKATSICINGIGSSNTKARHRVNVALHSRINNFTTRLEAAVLPHIISPQPSKAINIDNWTIPKNITLADPEFNRPNNIDVLLGAEFYHQLLSIGQIKLSNELPTLQNTRLGWVVAGKIEGNQLSTATCGICTDDETSLEEDIARLWELDEIKTEDKNFSTSERQCEAHFSQTHTIDKNGRYIVRIPFCDNPEALGESHGVAFNRFLSLERRLARAPEIKSQYERFMEEYEALGHMTQIEVDSIPKANYFIPHHCILRPQSETTKLRVVFDASAKTSSGVSLNDLMHTGPTVQSELFSILLRFRLPRFVFTTDVEKMYRQMLIHPEDRAFQIIIWRKDPTMPIKYYQLNTITYGTRAAPYLATKCLQKIAKDNMSRYPLGAQFLLDNFYVDDGIGGVNSLNTALTIQRELTHILKQHGLNLQKWHGNHQQLLQNVGGGNQEVNIDFSSGQAIKTLGLTWIPKSDKFCVKVCLGQSKRVTKRTVSSDLARLFDPLGILAPITVLAKMFIQELWQMKLSWDEALPAEMHTRWNTFRNDLESVNNMQFSRHIFKDQVTSTIQLHAFADASERAYGAAIYVRSVIKDGTIIVRLLCAKSRVAPLKRQTLPRLELCAALLSAQLMARVKKDLKLDSAPTFLWTDSEIVLAWINSKSSSYQTFVANRIAGIQDLTIAEQWRHVRSKENPADILSRGLSPRKLSACNLWFYGPMFLHGREECWPPMFSEAKAPSDNDTMERRKLAAVVTTASDATSMVYNIDHKGSFRTLQRIIGYMLRFIKHASKQQQQHKLELTVQELESALVVIIRSMQESDFQDDLKHLKKHNEVSKSSQISNLSPFLDTNGIIRVGGRLDSSTLSYDAKHPMLIPHNDSISKILMQMIHEQNRHCGPQALLSHMRQKYWPIKGKSAARSIVQHCIRCTKAKPKLLSQVMGNLPRTRITPARPFINSGVDFCGPFWVHYKGRGKKPHKAYIAVFCCFATKAVHLELVSDLTTDAFIGSLKRFISRRGHCQNLYCDNATNFVGARNQLKELSDAIYSNTANTVINRECTARGIAFHFIPPRAPHFGGLWEAAVKSAKHLLFRSVATANLTYEELDTVVIEIEGILNSRPISPMSEDPNDLAALTPGHFLIGQPLNAQIDPGSTSERISLLTRWKLVTHLKGEFWRRWSREYLCELQYRHKWKTQKQNIKPGDMVIIKEDNTAPLQWPIGRIIKVHPGDDGIVRVADVKTANGSCRRPIDRLAPLPIKTEDPIALNNHQHNEEPEIPINTQEVDIQPDSEEQPRTSLCISIPLERIPRCDIINRKQDRPQLKEIPKKKRRTSASQTLFMVILSLLIFPLVLAEQFQINHFGTKLGIHFEGIGSAAISPTEWQILIYYDLEGFWKDLEAFSNGTKALTHLCLEMRPAITCKNLATYFEHTEAELVLDSTLLSGRRHKRGAVDIVGNIAHSLFGVLDSEYADKMAHTITQVKENEAHLLKLLKNQTSIVDSTINIMKSDQKAVKAKFDNIDDQLSQIYNRIRNDTEEQYQERIYRIFSSLCIQLTLIAANLQRTQSSILDVLTNTHHGIISPLLLTPIQLQHEVDKIRFHLPESLELPVKQEDELQLYKLMSIKGGLTKNTVIFSITLPLIEHEQFQLFNLVPIPNWIDNIMVSVQPCSALLAINLNRNQYFTISVAELDSCLIIKEETYICSKGQVRYDQGSTVCACEINLFHNKTQSNCALHQAADNVAWIPLRHKNIWIYAIPTASRATAVCKKEITQLTLTGSGLLSLNPECILKHDFMSIQAQQVISSTLQTSYTSLWEFTEQTDREQLKPMLKKINTKMYISQTQNLTELQTALAMQEVFQLPNKIETQNYHHIAVGYTALIITVLILIYLVIKRKSKLTPTQSKNTPTPAPRNQHTSTDFTVHI